MDGVHSNSILIMGPPHVGKGRISTILSEKTNMPLVSLASSREKYYSELIEIFDRYYGKGYYVVVETGGGYHILVRTFKIRFNPHLLSKEVQALYEKHVSEGEEPYVDEKGVCKFECIVNDSQIPGIPLPGTYQYGKIVRVIK